MYTGLTLKGPPPSSLRSATRLPILNKTCYESSGSSRNPFFTLQKRWLDERTQTVLGGIFKHSKKCTSTNTSYHIIEKKIQGKQTKLRTKMSKEFLNLQQLLGEFLSILPLFSLFLEAPRNDDRIIHDDGRHLGTTAVASSASRKAQIMPS